MVDVKVEVRGIRELSAAFKQVDAELPRTLKTRFLAIATTVADAARNRVPRLTGAAQGSIKPKASPRGASIAFGGSVAEYYPWLDFGGRVGKNKSVKREIIPGGLDVYPAIAEHSEEITQQTEDAVNDVAHPAGFETREGI